MRFDRKAGILAVFLAGWSVGTCEIPPRWCEEPTEVQAETVEDWKPEVGRTYRPAGCRPRVVMDVWEHGVGWKYEDVDGRRECNLKTWRRWTQGRR